MPLKCLVLDLMPKGESPHEGRIVKWHMKNMGWDVRPVFKPDKGYFLKKLFNAYDCQFIHLSAHATPDSLKSGRQGKSFISTDEIYDYFEDRRSMDGTRLDKTKLVINSGCNTFSKEWHELFVDKLHSKHYVGATDEPTIAEGIMFPLLIYTNMWGQKKQPRVSEAFRKAKHSMRLESKWEIYPKS